MLKRHHVYVFFMILIQSLENRREKDIIVLHEPFDFKLTLKFKKKKLGILNSDIIN